MSSDSKADLVDGVQPEEHRGGEQDDRAAQRQPAEGARPPQPDAHQQPDGHPAAPNGTWGGVVSLSPIRPPQGIVWTNLSTHTYYYYYYCTFPTMCVFNGLLSAAGF